MKETGLTGKRRSKTIGATPDDGNSQRKRRRRRIKMRRNVIRHVIHNVIHTKSISFVSKTILTLYKMSY